MTGTLLNVAAILIGGGLGLLCGSRILSEAMIAEMSATGGVILFGLALANLLELKPIRVGNFLPALALAPLGVWLLGHLPFR